MDIYNRQFKDTLLAHVQLPSLLPVSSNYKVIEGQLPVNGLVVVEYGHADDHQQVLCKCQYSTDMHSTKTLVNA